MPFKLIILGSIGNNKISLNPGVHKFGRETLLHCGDKRISRQHGELVVEKTSIILKSLHINPCYYKKKGSNESEVLNQGDSVTLSNADRFGLLLENFWYEIVHVLDDENTDTIQTQSDIEEKSLQADINALLKNEAAASCDSTSSNDTILNKDIKTENANESQSILNQDEPLNNVIDSNESTNETNNSSPLKRSHSEENSVEIEVKKIKKESDNETSNEAKPSTSDQAVSQKIKKESDNETSNEAKPSTSDQAVSQKIKKESDNETSNEAKPSTSDQARTSNDNDSDATKPPQPLRERCMYGANCYRKNPVHLVQFSHPRDADWGAGPQGVCPFGAACAKRDQRHWRDHAHPPGARPPVARFAPAGGHGNQVVERHGNVFIINAHAVNFYDDHFQVTDSDGDSVDYDYEF